MPIERHAAQVRIGRWGAPAARRRWPAQGRGWPGDGHLGSPHQDLCQACGVLWGHEAWEELLSELWSLNGSKWGVMHIGLPGLP